MKGGIFQGGYAAAATTAPATIRLLNWNIERGLRLPAIIDVLTAENPDVCLFQEVDLNARRTAKRHIANVLAARFELNYVFGIEFEELSQGAEDDSAFHGQAVLARAPIRKPRVLRFHRQSHAWDPHWYLPRWPVFQPRRGARMALAAEIPWGATRLIVYDLHLESRGDDGLRLSQLLDVVHDASRYPPDIPIVIAGDFNSGAAPWLFTTYLAHSGFTDVCAGPARRPTKPNGKTLDWIFVRGPVTCAESKVHDAIRASDHYPVSTTLTLA